MASFEPNFAATYYDIRQSQLTTAFGSRVQAVPPENRRIYLAFNIQISADIYAIPSGLPDPGTGYPMDQFQRRLEFKWSDHYRLCQVGWDIVDPLFGGQLVQIMEILFYPERDIDRGETINVR